MFGATLVYTITFLGVLTLFVWPVLTVGHALVFYRQYNTHNQFRWLLALLVTLPIGLGAVTSAFYYNHLKHEKNFRITTWALMVWMFLVVAFFALFFSRVINLNTKSIDKQTAVEAQKKEEYKETIKVETITADKFISNEERLANFLNSCSLSNLAAKNDNNETPLLIAVRLQNVPMIKVIVSHIKKMEKLNPTIPDNDDIANSKKLTLDNVINSYDKGGINPILAATYNGDNNIVKLLLLEGADIESVNNDGDTPLMIAAKKKNIELVKSLIKSNASITHVNKIGLSALQYAEDNEKLKNLLQQI